MINVKATLLARQALSCLDLAGMGASPAACHLQSALSALGYEGSVKELEALFAGDLPVRSAA